MWRDDPGKMLQAIDIEADSYTQSQMGNDYVNGTGQYTMQTLFEWGVDFLNLDFTFWNYWRGGAGMYALNPEGLAVIAQTDPYVSGDDTANGIPFR